MGRRLVALSVAALVGACALAACGTPAPGESTASTTAALGGAAAQLQLEARTEACNDDRVRDVLEVTNTGTTAVPLSAITIKLWADDTSGHPLDADVTAAGHVQGDPRCDRDVYDVRPRAEAFSPACGPDPEHQANWEVTILDGDGAVLAPGATWKDIAIELSLDGHHDFSPGPGNWYSGCQGKAYQHTSSYAVYVSGQLVTSSTGVPPSCKAAHGSQQLGGHVAGGQGNVPIVGPVAAAQPVTLAITLPLTHTTELQTFLQQAYDPTSPNYRKFLTPAAFGAAYGASQADYDALDSFVQSKGLTVAQRYSNRSMMTVYGTAAQVESALYTTLNVYQRSDGTTYDAAANEPSLDLGAAVLRIDGLDNATVPVPADLGGGTGPYYCNPTGLAADKVESYVGTDMATIFLPCNAAAAQPLDGALQTIALFEESADYANDYLDYVSYFPGLNTSPSVAVELVDTANVNYAPPMPPLSGDCSGAPPDTHATVSGTAPALPANCQNTGPLVTASTAVYLGDVKRADEVALDVQMVLSIAPKAHVILYEQAQQYSSGGHLGNNFFPELIFAQIAEDDSAQTISVSWWWRNHTGYDPAMAATFQQFAAQGQSLFVSAMDLGSYVPGAPLENVPDPMIDSTFITTVGGTQLKTSGNAASQTLAYKSETTWNDSENRNHSNCVNTPPYLDGSGNLAACNSVSGGGLCSGYVHGDLLDNTFAGYPGLPLPDYQANLPTAYGGSSIPANTQLSATVRMIPDVSMPADGLTTFQRNIITGATTYTTYDPMFAACQGGTSAGTPMWAAIVALMNQQLQRSSQPGPVGFANPTLYALASASGTSYAANFHDVADGSNNAYDAAATPTIYTAQAGYDLTTGLGTAACGLLSQPVCLKCGGGTCLNLDTDVNNCGACAHACQGGTCVGGQCQPVKLASVIGSTFGLATDGTYVYWSDQGTSNFTGFIQRVPVGGGTVVSLASNVVVPVELAIDSTNVYWDTGADPGGDAIFYAPKAGGVSTNFMPNFDGIGLAADGTNVYWGDFGGGGLFQAPIATGTPVTTLSSSSPMTIVVDSANVYWTTGTEIDKTPIGGGPVTAIATGLNFAGYFGGAINGLTTDGTSVYWVELDTLGNGRVATTNISASGGPGTTLATTAGTFPDAVAVDATNVYWANESGAGIMSVPKAGGSVTTLTTIPAGQTIAVDGTSVYWSVYTDAVYKIAK